MPKHQMIHILHLRQNPSKILAFLSNQTDHKTTKGIIFHMMAPHPSKGANLQASNKLNKKEEATS